MNAQPPPDAPAPPRSEAAELSHQKWNWLMVGGIISVIGCFIWVTRPIVICSHRNSDQTEAVSNARQIGLALHEFEVAYGKFPDETTVERVRQTTGTTLKLGNGSANDFFRQVLANDSGGNEQIYHAKIPGARKPDGVINGAKALEKGEIGFSYLAGLDYAGNPNRLLLGTPLVPGTHRFDRTVFDGKAVILKMDNSATSITIDSSGRGLVNGGNILDPSHPVWGKDDKWKLAWPE